MIKSFNPGVYFEIAVIDLERAVQFYTSVFGFEFERETIHDNEMALFPLDENAPGISGALAKGEIYKPTKEGTLIYLKSKDIDKTLDQAIHNGGAVLFPKTSNGEWGFVAELEDSEGNRIGLLQALD
ncbi:VOC family protein [Flavobacterium microcysteis]